MSRKTKEAAPAAALAVADEPIAAGQVGEIKNGHAKAAAAGERPFQALEIEPQHLAINPLNPAARSTPDAELVGSIRELGILQPLVVRRLEDGERLEEHGADKRWLLLAGHRRLAAAQQVGLARVPCVVLEGADLDGRVLLAENVVRRDLHPLEEAAIVGEVTERLKSQEAVAAALGRSVRWVARRQAMAGLAGPIQRAVRDPKHYLNAWPPTWLEELALLAPAAQQKVTGVGVRDGDTLRFVDSIDELRHQIASKLMPIRLAPWKPDDAELVPSVGACTTCPKTTAARPTLFGAGEPIALDKASCTDSVCWLGKLKTFMAARVRDAKREHGAGLLLLDRTRYDDRNDSVVGCSNRNRFDDLQRAIAVPQADVKSGQDYAPASAKTGKPALVVDGAGIGTVVYVRPKAAVPTGASGRPKAPVRPRAEAEEIRRRRARLEALGEAVRAYLPDERGEKHLLDWAKQAGMDVTKLVADTRELLTISDNDGFLHLPVLKAAALAKVGDTGANLVVLAALWIGVLEAAESAASGLARCIPYPELKALDLDRFGWLATRVGFSLEEPPAARADASAAKGAKGAKGRQSKRAAKGGA